MTSKLMAIITLFRRHGNCTGFHGDALGSGQVRVTAAKTTLLTDRCQQCCFIGSEEFVHSGTEKMKTIHATGVVLVCISALVFSMAGVERLGPFPWL